VLAILGLGLRIALVQLRWINPDEGAHLMDARLAMGGLLPEVDFQARQPFYVYTLALWLQVTGAGFEGVRVMMALLDTLVGVLIYAIGIQVLPSRSALLGAALYLLLPFVVFWAPLVHTEPLTMVLVAASLLAVVRRVTGAGSTPELAGAGACLALACYVRQSAVAGVLAALALLILYRRPLRTALRDAGWLATGYAAVVAVMLAWYARRLSLSQLWESSVNPLHLPLRSLMHVVGGASDAPVEVAVQAATAFRSTIQPWSATLINLRGAVSLSSLVLAACAVFLIHWALLERRRAPEAKQLRLAASLVLLWAGSLMLPYGYWIFHRGFYPQYAVEFLPPLALGAGHGLALGWAVSERLGRWRIAAVLLACVAVALLAHGAAPDRRYTSMAYAALAGVLALAGSRPAWWRHPAAPLAAAAAAAGLVWLVLRWIFRAPLHPADGLAAAVAAAGLIVMARARWPEPVSPAALLGLGVVGALAVATAVFSLRVLEPRYFCVWAPATVREVAAYVREATPPGAQVMSGAVIWEFVADRPPFGTISHPLAFQGGGHAAALPRIDSALAAAPPAVVVLDGYTELTYLAESEAVTRAVRDRYEEVRVIFGSRYPVRILKRRS
jgi:4-amino-4-deoxy-L-arabinose transferase-like glycosyltransferase